MYLGRIYVCRILSLLKNTHHVPAIWSLCVNMTSSTKPEVHNVSQHRPEDRNTAIGNNEHKNLMKFGRVVFTARRYAKRGICRRRVSVRLSVCVCVCLSHSGIVSKRRITQIMPHDRSATLVYTDKRVAYPSAIAEPLVELCEQTDGQTNRQM